MKRAVFKYPVPRNGSFSLFLESGAKVLHVAEQFGKAWIWVEVDPSADTAPREFVAVMTGEKFDADGLHHVGTVLLDSGSFVLHVYERN